MTETNAGFGLCRLVRGDTTREGRRAIQRQRLWSHGYYARDFAAFPTEQRRLDPQYKFGSWRIHIVIVAEIQTVNVILSSCSSQERGYLPEVKQQVSEMAINGSGIRDTARLLKISPTTVIDTLKKKPHCLEQVNTTLLEQMQVAPASVMVVRVEDAEMDARRGVLCNLRNSNDGSGTRSSIAVDMCWLMF